MLFTYGSTLDGEMGSSTNCSKTSRRRREHVIIGEGVGVPEVENMLEEMQD